MTVEEAGYILDDLLALSVELLEDGQFTVEQLAEEIKCNYEICKAMKGD